jgi:hypothetical protein
VASVVDPSDLYSCNSTNSQQYSTVLINIVGRSFLIVSAYSDISDTRPDNNRFRVLSDSDH